MRLPARCTSLALAFLAGLTVAAAQQTSGPTPQAVVPAFQGKLLLALSDTDMLPSAYIDGKLGPPAGIDQLSVIRLDRPAPQLRAVTVPVSNSVAGPPGCIAVTPDGRYAIAVETRASRQDSRPAARFAELGEGHLITVTDLADPDRPRVVQQVRGQAHPLTVSVNYDGSLVAVAYGDFVAQPEAGASFAPLVLYRFHNGRLSAPETPVLPGFNMYPDDALISAEFHPHRNQLAVLYSKNPRLSLVEVDPGASLRLTRWGEDVNVDRDPYLARYTPDGRFVLVNSMFDAVQVRGTVSSIQLASSTATGGKPQHTVVSRAFTGFGPEGLAVSPDGRWVATANLEHSYYAVDDPRQGFFSSVTLLRLDPSTGQLDTVGTFAFDGRLPEAPVFDDSSRFLAVTNFAFFDEATQPGGSIDIWRIAGDFTDVHHIELVKTMTSIPVARGPQSIAIVREARPSQIK